MMPGVGWVGPQPHLAGLGAHTPRYLASQPTITTITKYATDQIQLPLTGTGLPIPRGCYLYGSPRVGARRSADRRPQLGQACLARRAGWAALGVVRRLQSFCEQDFKPRRKRPKVPGVSLTGGRL